VTTRLLVTGFGPFPRMPRNPSGRLAIAIARSPRWDHLRIRATALVLPTTYAAIDEILMPRLRDERPDAVLMLGVAARARWIRVETCGRNQVASLTPDAAGGSVQGALGTAPVPMRRTQARAGAALAILRRKGWRARLSSNAGRYLCNASYYAALQEDCPILFIHVPRPGRALRDRGMSRTRDWHDLLAEALGEIGVELARQSRQQRALRLQMSTHRSAA
jgi:pyroglutamyl-peptidase